VYPWKKRICIDGAIGGIMKLFGKKRSSVIGSFVILIQFYWLIDRKLGRHVGTLLKLIVSIFLQGLRRLCSKRLLLLRWIVKSRSISQTQSLPLLLL
jgi:hypothetical protein